MGRPDDLLKRAHTWIVGNDTGISSISIWARMLGVVPARMYGPSDPDDLGRCLRLLHLIPEWAPRMHEMANVSESWRHITPHWDRLAQMMAEEVGIDWSKGNRAPKTYEAMRRVRDGGEA